jgi:hypothetical protein
MPKNRMEKNRYAVFSVFVGPSLKGSASGLNVIPLIGTLATNYSN